MSRVGYVFIRDLYLNQLGEQVNIVTKMISSHLDKKYLEFFSVGIPTKSADDYFREQFYKNSDSKFISEIFIFDEEFKIVVHSDPMKTRGETEPKLFLNQKEIFDLVVNEALPSLPFKGDDGNWYLWGFSRLNTKYWLAVRESAARFEKVESFSTLFWLIGLGGILLTILVSLFVAKKITQPIDILVEFSGEIGKGNFKINAPEKMKGEFNILTRAMDNMKLSLAENHREREKILAQIAHEIRNPLGGIELLANLVKENLSSQKIAVSQNGSLKEEIPDEFESIEQFEKNKDYLNKILKEINVLKSLITSYLNFSRPVPANPSWIILPELLNEVKDIFIDRLNEKDLHLFINSDLNILYFDEDHLRQLLVNLVANSVEALRDGGIITIKSYKKLNQWVISVSDNGPGIAENDLQFVFDPFFTTKKNGTGLGLAISKKLCLENNAELTAQNNPGKGAMFTIIKNAEQQTNIISNKRSD